MNEHDFRTFVAQALRLLVRLTAAILWRQMYEELEFPDTKTAHEKLLSEAINFTLT